MFERSTFVKSVLRSMSALVVAVSVLGGSVSAIVAAPPEGFVTETVVTGLTEPTATTFAPDGRMFIIERAGIIKVVPAGTTTPLSTPLLDLTGQINTDMGERGLVGIALDPNFASNGYYYVFYTTNALRDRVERFTASGNATVANSGFVVWQDTVEAQLWHHGGTVAFGPDGKLYISTGDGFDTTSGSGNVSQRLDSFRGKILRVNSDGTIPSDNPWASDGNPNTLDAIWARGLRNPFRFSFDSLSGSLYIGDVGGNNQVSSIEEINLGVAGANYGWPICEGNYGTSGMTNPIYLYEHADRDASVTGGFVYRGGNFPAEYQGSFFYGDYVQNWVCRLTFDGSGNVQGSQHFEPTNGTSDGPFGEIVDLKQGPDGALYYTDIGMSWEQQSNPGTIRRIKYDVENQAPVIATVSAQPSSGPGPSLETTFSATVSDPENDTLTYLWEFGDSQTATISSPVHTYTQKGQYTARLTVSDATNQTISEPMTIVVGTPPVATIDTPLAGATFKAGDVITFSGSATDADSTLTAANYSWSVALLHNSHTHPEVGPIDGQTSGTFTIPSSGHDLNNTTRFQFILTVTDEDGLQDTNAVIVDPQTVDLSIDTVPSGLPINFNQETNVATPFMRNMLVNFQSTIEAPTPVTSSGQQYEFAGWSDGGERLHTITAPESSQSYIASYSAVASDNFALSFDGSNDLAQDGMVANAAEFTAEAWVWAQTANQAAILIGNFDDNNGWSLELLNGRPVFWRGLNGSWANVSSATTLSTQAWHHVAVTHVASTGVARIFVDGQQVATGTVGVLGQGPNIFLGGASGYPYFTGLLDEVRLSNSVRYTGSYTVPTAGFSSDAQTIALFSLNEGTGQTAVSSGGSSATLLLGSSSAVESSDPLWVTSTAPTGGATPPPSPSPSPSPSPVPTPSPSPTPTPTPTPSPSPVPTPIPTPTPQPGTMLQFNGSNDYVRSVNIPLSTQYTYEAWVRRMADTNGYESILSDANSGYGQAMFTLFIDGGNNDCYGQTDQFAYYQASGGFTLCSGVSANIGSWYHVAVTRDSGGVTRYFVNGVLTASANSPAPSNSTGRLAIGRAGDYNGEYFPGFVDEVRVSNAPQYTATFTPSTTSLAPNASTVALYHLNAGTGQSVVDSSSNNYTATLGGSTSVDSADPTWATGSPVGD